MSTDKPGRIARPLYRSLYRLVAASLLLALALLLPFLTGQIPQIGGMLCPMHLPVLLCGFLCGPVWGLAVGAIAPLLRNLLFGMPPLFPKAIAMAFELMTYGLLSGLLSRLMPKKPVFLWVSLILSMIGGRLVWGAARFALAGFDATAFPFSAFVAGAVTEAIPGILLQLVLVPPVVLLLRRAGYDPEQT